MDYAVQLLAVIGLFTFGGLWLKDHAGLPMWGVIAMFFAGVVSGMIVIYQRGVEESKKEAAKTTGSSSTFSEKSATSQKAQAQDSQDDAPIVELGVFGSDEDEKR